MEPTPKPSFPATLPSGLPSPTILRGSCLCGRIQLESRMMPEAVTICHCLECRKASSNPFLTFGLFHNDYIEWKFTDSHGTKTLLGDLTEGIQLTYYSDVAVRGWCPNCGTPLFMKYHCRPDGTNITLGLVDDQHLVGQMPPIKEHIFLDDKAVWWNLPASDRTLRYRVFNEPFTARLQDWAAKGRPKRSDIPPVPPETKVHLQIPPTSPKSKL